MHPGCPARTARLPGAHAGAPRRNAGLAVGRPGTDGVGCQYYQPTCVTVTELPNPFISGASQAIPCHSRERDFPRRRDRQGTQSGTGHMPRHALSGVSITPEKMNNVKKIMESL